MSILSKLAEGMDIQLNTPVQRIALREEGGVSVVDLTGKEWVADKVSHSDSTKRGQLSK